MSQTKQAAGDRPIPVGRDPNVDAARQKLYAGQLQKGILGASAAGLGIGGLYYLSNYLADKYRKATKLPDPEELATAPISEVTAPEEEADDSFIPEMPKLQMPSLSSVPFLGSQAPEKPAPKQKKVANFDPAFIYAPALGAGAGALIGAARAGKGRKRQNAILGATLGGLGGLGTAAVTSKPLWDYIAQNMPKKDLIPGISQDPDKVIPAETPAQHAWRAVANTTLPAVGAAGGLALADSVARQSKNEQNLRGIEDARRAYFTSLTGREPPAKEKQDDDEDTKEEKKSSVDTALDNLYSSYVAGTGRFEKAGENPAGVTGTNTLANWLANLSYQPDRNWSQFGNDFFSGVPNTYRDVANPLDTMILAGGLGAGAIGAKYMYDRTKARSNSRNLLRAQEARRRMQGLDSPWVDPKELADIKNLATSGEAASARGV